MQLAHGDPIAPVIFGVTGILFFAVLGRYAARRLGQPAVIGELIMGIVLGNVAYFGGADLFVLLREGHNVFDIIGLTFAGDSMQHAVLANGPAEKVLAVMRGENGAVYMEVAHTVDVFSRYGVIFLLFLVGLETSFAQMRRVGGESSRVAVIGVALPFLLGFRSARLLMPELSIIADLFIAATLGATSVGITTRVLRDIHQDRSHEAQVILGAAVIDDILGLLMLAVVSSIIVSGGLDLRSALRIVLLAIAFLAGAIVLGPHFLKFIIHLVRHLDLVEAKMFISFLFVMVLAWLANAVSLATIVGAFTAGLILHDAYFCHWRDARKHRLDIKDLITPLEVILAPIFFVLMGIQVKLETFYDWHVLTMAGGLLVAATLGKLASGRGAARNSKRLAIGLGMLPRGEVGLIFAAIGKSLGVITDALFSALVLMVIATTLLAPPLLTLVMGRETPPD